MKKHVFQMRKFEKAQFLPIVAIGMVAIIGLAAILLDGGVLMANRRAAQAAADAGALAGARLSCQHASASTIEAEARHYAVDLNNADPDTTTVTYSSGTGLVTVVAQMQQDSWFAKIFDQNQLTTRASASAGCFFPDTAVNVLPLAFYYRSAPVKGDGSCDADGECSLVNWNYVDLMETLKITNMRDQPLDDIYIIADSTKLCEKPSGEYVCAEMAKSDGGGNRQWIDLTNLSTGSNIKDVIKEGLYKPLYLPAWIGPDSGNITSAYKGDNYLDLPRVPGFEGYPARLVMVPLFTHYCPKGDTECKNNAPYATDDFLTKTNDNQYRLAGFAPFVVTCATFAGKCEFGNCIPANTPPNDNGKKACPGNVIANGGSIGQNSLEGYFVDGLPADAFTWGTEGVDAGIYIISLSD